MGLRTYGVTGSNGRRPAEDINIDGYNSSLGNQVSFPGGEYSRQDIRPNLGDYITSDEPIEGDYEQMRPELGGQTQLDGVMESTITGDQLGPTGYSPARTSQERAAEYYLKDSAEQKAKDRQIAIAGATISVIKATGGVINANTKFSQTMNQNNFNIQQAQLETMRMASDAQRMMLEEQTKGSAKGDRALVSAIARGQSAGGDLAQRAVKTESVIAAQNMMAIEINSMRRIFNMESQVRQLESDNRMAEINRDLEVSQAITQGITGAGASILGGM